MTEPELKPRPLEEFAGANEHERWINWYLTNRFIVPDAPADECLTEAREILEHIRRAPWKPEEIEALKAGIIVLMEMDNKMGVARETSFVKHAATLERMIEERS